MQNSILEKGQARVLTFSEVCTQTYFLLDYKKIVRK